MEDVLLVGVVHEQELRVLLLPLIQLSLKIQLLLLLLLLVTEQGGGVNTWMILTMKVKPCIGVTQPKATQQIQYIGVHVVDICLSYSFCSSDGMS